MSDDKKTVHEPDANLDPLSGEKGAHPVGTGIGAASAGATGAAIGGAVGGPVGAVVGAVIGAVSGGLVGKECGRGDRPYGRRCLLGKQLQFPSLRRHERDLRRLSACIPHWL
jgi:hypothetical protein